jgi:hypothetical protein
MRSEKVSAFKKVRKTRAQPRQASSEEHSLITSFTSEWNCLSDRSVERKTLVDKIVGQLQERGYNDWDHRNVSLHLSREKRRRLRMMKDLVRFEGRGVDLLRFPAAIPSRIPRAMTPVPVRVRVPVPVLRLTQPEAEARAEAVAVQEPSPLPSADPELLAMDALNGFGGLDADQELWFAWNLVSMDPLSDYDWRW